jgi:hypothetical protein
MTKEEMIGWLENIIEKNKQYMAGGESSRCVIEAMGLLASLKGWKTQCCSRQSRPMRDSRLNLIGSKK